MPSSRSATKRLRQNVAHNIRNRSIRSNVRSQIRKVREAISGGDAQATESEFRVAVQALDRAAGKRIIHSNTAARTKSRLSAAIKGMKAG